MSDLPAIWLADAHSALLAALGAAGSHGSGGGGWQPNWLLALIIGALLGTVFDKYGGAILYPFRRLRTDPYVREWWEYHLSYKSGERTLRQSKLSIRKGVRTNVRKAFFWHIAHDSSGAEQKGLTYKGTLRIEKDQLLIELDATTHDEHLVYRFLNPIPSNDSVIPGIWMSFDHDSRPAAGAAILSDKKMSAANAEKTILRHTAAGAIRIE